MKSVDLLEKEILALSEEQRFELLERVSAAIVDATPSEEEALAREKEWEQDPSLGITLQQLKHSVGRD